MFILENLYKAYYFQYYWKLKHFICMFRPLKFPRPPKVKVTRLLQKQNIMIWNSCKVCLNYRKIPTGSGSNGYQNIAFFHALYKIKAIFEVNCKFVFNSIWLRNVHPDSWKSTTKFPSSPLLSSGKIKIRIHWSIKRDQLLKSGFLLASVRYNQSCFEWWTNQKKQDSEIWFGSLIEK